MCSKLRCNEERGDLDGQDCDPHELGVSNSIGSGGGGGSGASAFTAWPRKPPELEEDTHFHLLRENRSRWREMEVSLCGCLERSLEEQFIRKIVNSIKLRIDQNHFS